MMVIKMGDGEPKTKKDADVAFQVPGRYELERMFVSKTDTD